MTAGIAIQCSGNWKAFGLPGKIRFPRLDLLGEVASRIKGFLASLAARSGGPQSAIAAKPPWALSTAKLLGIGAQRSDGSFPSARLRVPSGKATPRNSR